MTRRSFAENVIFGWRPEVKDSMSHEDYVGEESINNIQKSTDKFWLIFHLMQIVDDSFTFKNLIRKACLST